LVQGFPEFIIGDITADDPQVFVCRLSRFSLDALVNIAAALGCRVQIALEAA
jgi:hypothetical protein